MYRIAILWSLLVSVGADSRPSCIRKTVGQRSYLFCGRVESKNEVLNATMALLACRKEGGHLVSIKTQQDQLDVEEVMGNISGCKVFGGDSINLTYIGLTDSEEEDVWKWADGSSLVNTQFTNWKLDINNITCKNQPNGLKQCDDTKAVDQDYVAIQMCDEKTYGKWFDVKGDKKLGFMCDITDAGRDAIISTRTPSVSVTTTHLEVTGKNDTGNPGGEIFKHRTKPSSRPPSRNGSDINRGQSGRDPADNKSRTPPMPRVTPPSGTLDLRATPQTLRTYSSEVRVTLSSISTWTDTPWQGGAGAEPTPPDEAAITTTVQPPSIQQRNINMEHKLKCLMLTLQPMSADESCGKTFMRFIPANPVQLFEDEISLSAAKLMLETKVNETVNVVTTGIEVKMTPVRSLSRGKNFTINFGKKINCHDCDSAQLDLGYNLRKFHGNAFIVAATLKSEVLENSGVYTFPLAEDGSKTTSYDVQNFIDKSTSVMSVSLFVGDSEQSLRRVSIPATTIFDIRNDISEARAMPNHTRRIATEVERNCVYLDKNNQWSTFGCRSRNNGPGSVRCECNHTTSFAVIVSVRTFDMPEWELIFLLIFEIIGVIFLSLTLCLLVWLRRILRKDRVLTQINLTLSLLLMHISMLIGSYVPSVEGLCVFMTLISHYFMICSLMWMLNEGLVLYKKTCSSAMNFEIGKIKRWLFVLGWAIPAVYVLICLGIGMGLEKYLDITVGYTAALARQKTTHDVQKYERCWLGKRFQMILAAVVPLIISITISLYFLIRVSRVIWFMNVQAKEMRPSDAKKKHGASKSTFRAVALLIPVLGVPWLLAFMVNIPGAELVFAGIHGVVNGLQGLTFFIIYIVMNRETRNATKRRLSRKSLKSSHTFSFSVSISGISIKKSKRSRPTGGRKYKPDVTSDSHAVSNTADTKPDAENNTE